jgi:hypothetical protein
MKKLYQDIFAVTVLALIAVAAAYAPNDANPNHAPVISAQSENCHINQS